MEARIGAEARGGAGGRTAPLERNPDGRLVSRGDTAVTDDMMFALIDSGRR